MRERLGLEREITDLSLASLPARHKLVPDSAAPDTESSPPRRYVPVEELERKFPLADQPLFKFRSLVYLAQIGAALKKKKEFVDNLPKLATVEQVEIHPRAAKPLQELLDAARLTISGQGRQVTVKAGNAYRSTNWQLKTWATKRFPQYYKQATAETIVKKTGAKRPPLIAPGDFSEAAAKKLAGYIGGRFAAPGFSNHQHGLAVDFHTIERFKMKFVELTASFGKDNWMRDLWWKSWLWNWLEREKNAYRFGFVPYKKEPWHWEYRPDQARRVLNVDSEAEKTAPRMPFAPDRPPISNSIPALIKRENDVAVSTLYVDITVGDESPAIPMTGIFISQHYREQPDVDLIIYLHGHKKKPWGKEYRWYKGLSIDGYWKPTHFPYFLLREGLNDVRKNMVLVAPTLHYLVHGGHLTSRRGFEEYVNKVMAALAAYGPHKRQGQRPKAGRIILAAHSAGGSVMLKIAQQGGDTSGRIQECWGFDCLYSGRDKQTGKKYFTQPNSWLRWAALHPDKKLFVYYKGSTAEESLYLKGNARRKQLGNVSVEESTATDHFWVPLKHWSDRIQKAFVS
jgi:hypothetical protein